MRILFIIIFALACALALGIFLQENPGRMVFSYGGTTVQTSFALFILVLGITFILLYFIFSVVTNLLRLPKSYRRWIKFRDFRRSEKYLTQSLKAMMEGDWHVAEEFFRKGAAYSRLPMINYLGAARAAQKQGAIQRRDHYLRLAHEHSADGSLAIGLTQAELQLNQQQTEQAYATLKHLEAGKAMGRNQINAMLLEAGFELKEWREVLKLLPELERKKLLSTEMIQAKQLEAYAGLLRQAGEMQKRDKLDEEWNKIPKKLRQELYLIEVYVGERLRFPNSGDCEPILRQALKHKWDQVLVRLYGLIEGEDIAKQLTFAERMLTSHPRDADLHLTLGRLCLRNRLWGKAKSYLEESIAIRPNPDAYRELALLLESQGDQATAAEYYQKGLNLVTDHPHLKNIKLLDNTEDSTIENPAVAAARRVN